MNRFVMKSAGIVVLLALSALLAGCLRGPAIIAPELRKPIDRSLVEFPADMQFERFISGLRAPTAMAFDTQRNVLLVAESGIGGEEPQILAFYLDKRMTTRVYPQGRVLGPFRTIPFHMYAPIGGMAVKDGVIYVSHRDKQDMGVISALTYDGKGTTVVGGLPAQGEHGVTDIAFGPDDRLYFGVGSATNSGVVGLDDWEMGWVQRHRNFADVPYIGPDGSAMKLRGPRFNTIDPRQGLFASSELAITGPFQPFGQFYRTSILPPEGSKPNAAIFSVRPSGGVSTDLIVEAFGIRYPGGLAFNDVAALYASDRGMEYRGTRPVLNDPDSVLKILRGQNYGWPDATADLRPVTDAEFKPEEAKIRKTGYLELTFLLEHLPPYDPPFGRDQRDSLVRGVFPSMSGAAKMTFLPDSDGPLGEYRRQLVVALAGDQAPFANSGKKLRGPVGYKVVRLDVERDALPQDFIRNTAGLPRSMSPGHSSDLLERPIDVKIGPDGYLYVLDMGQLTMKGGREHVGGNSGQVFRLRPPGAPTTAPSSPSNQ